ncbi:uncharacterized protein LOC121860086 [Homarus americanus]|uniref:Putative CCCH-type zinc finger-containing protein n=1 Tax=Homarus americanus TaxID=6706 RepID=A0A8J5N5H3_HOMAM|nr:uncharacterized protein LOC121860086 [Homarus americanus]KAG7173786.1 putative CCCH-type zinc finger-containing protein [Homarus americanus]
MAGLVADYGSSSDEENEDAELAEELSIRVTTKKAVNYFETPSEQRKHIKRIKKDEPRKPEVLANPLRGNAIPSPFGDDHSASVFFNPFHKAQEDKKMVLEKHVKMTENPKDVLEINGKKICWNYRKGRCKFGHNCKFAHDSDISQPSDSREVQNLNTNATGASVSYGDLGTQVLTAEPIVDELTVKKKKRPGLADGIVPGKKVQKLHRKQQAKETPWLLKQ